MRACWTFSPGDRISFRSIVDELVPYENEDFRLHAYYHTQPNHKPSKQYQLIVVIMMKKIFY